VPRQQLNDTETEEANGGNANREQNAVQYHAQQMLEQLKLGGI